VTSLSDYRVLLFVLNGNPSADLARIAIRRGWPLRRVPLATQAFEEIRHRRPGAVLVQVSLGMGEDLELIRLVRSDLAHVSLIAVAVPHHVEIERAVRSAGASCYLPGAADADLVEQAVAATLERQQNTMPLAAMKSKVKPSRIAAQDRITTSFSTPPKNHGRRVRLARRPTG